MPMKQSKAQKRRLRRKNLKQIINQIGLEDYQRQRQIQSENKENHVPSSTDSDSLPFIQPLSSITICIVNQDGEKKVIDTINPNDTIFDIKSKYGTELTLMYNRIELEDNKSLNTYNIPDGAVLNTIKVITLILKHSNKRPQLIVMSPSSTICELKQKVRSVYNFPSFAAFKLCINHETNSRSLEHDKCTLIDYGIYDEQILHVIQQNHHWQSTTITVKTLTGRSIELYDVKPYQTVLSLKLRIQRQERIYHGHQRLIWAGKQLQDGLTLLDEKIEENSTMHLVLRLVRHGPYFNDLLCDEEISEVHSSSDPSHQRMMHLWGVSSVLESVYLQIEQVYKIEKNFKQNMSIYNALVSVQRNKANQNEDMLFHGTSLENIKKIINSGFNRDYNINSLYGKGTYFSNQAQIAAEYCTEFTENHVFAMLACKTYIGESTRGSLNMKSDELYKDDKVTQYDSLVNDVDNPAIYVVNRDYHSVPHYIIVFTIREIQQK